MNIDRRHPAGDLASMPMPSPLTDLTRVVRDIWPGEAPRKRDMVAVLVVGILGLPFVVVVGNSDPWRPPEVVAGTPGLLLAAALVPLFSLPFLWVRQHPERAAAVVVLAHLGQLLVLSEPSPVDVAAPMAVYAVARWSSSLRARRAFLLVAAVGSLLAGLSWSRNAGPDGGGRDIAFVLTVTVVCFGGMASAWLLGALVRQREQARTEIRSRAEAVEQGRLQSVRLAAQEERARIAREMHDVVAHSLSVVVVQSDGATYALDRAAESGDAETMGAAMEAARAALATIGQTARESLADTRRLVAVLRQDDGGAEYAPTGGVADLGDLFAPLRDAGLDIHTDVAGAARPLPRTADLAAYRVVQESLTNVIKHAGGASVWVSLDYLDQALMITVRDDGPGVTAAPDGAGHGLVGMRERVSAVGGGLWAGGAPGGGFLVEARIPYDARTPMDRPSMSDGLEGR